MVQPPPHFFFYFSITVELRHGIQGKIETPDAPVDHSAFSLTRTFAHDSTNWHTGLRIARSPLVFPWLSDLVAYYTQPHQVVVGITVCQV